jgi:hypothetical protein
VTNVFLSVVVKLFGGTWVGERLVSAANPLEGLRWDGINGALASAIDRQTVHGAHLAQLAGSAHLWRSEDGLHVRFGDEATAKQVNATVSRIALAHAKQLVARATSPAPPTGQPRSNLERVTDFLNSAQTSSTRPTSGWTNTSARRRPLGHDRPLTRARPRPAGVVPGVAPGSWPSSSNGTESRCFGRIVQGTQIAASWAPISIAAKALDLPITAGRAPLVAERQHHQGPGRCLRHEGHGVEAQ